MTIADIIADSPYLREDDILAAIAYGASQLSFRTRRGLKNRCRAEHKQFRLSLIHEAESRAELMPHDNRPKMNPPPKHTFDQVYNLLAQKPGKQSPTLYATGRRRVAFIAEAKITLDGRRVVSLPHNNKIYPCCWGNQANHMGRDGQRIGQYARPLDDWAARP